MWRVVSETHPLQFSQVQPCRSVCGCTRAFWEKSLPQSSLKAPVPTAMWYFMLLKIWLGLDPVKCDRPFKSFYCLEDSWSHPRKSCVIFSTCHTMASFGKKIYGGRWSKDSLCRMSLYMHPSASFLLALSTVSCIDPLSSAPPLESWSKFQGLVTKYGMRGIYLLLLLLLIYRIFRFIRLSGL